MTTAAPAPAAPAADDEVAGRRGRNNDRQRCARGRRNARGAHVRWSTGLTARLNHPRIQPAVTVAAVRGVDGWGGTVSIDLAAVAREEPDEEGEDVYD